VSDGVDDVDLEEVGGRGVGIVQRLFLASQPLRGVLTRHDDRSKCRDSEKIIDDYLLSI